MQQFLSYPSINFKITVSYTDKAISIVANSDGMGIIMIERNIYEVTFPRLLEIQRKGGHAEK